MPPIAEIRRLAREAMRREADNPWEFSRLMRRWIPRIEVFPYRLCDGGHLVLRARFTLRLASLVPQAEDLQRIADTLTREMEVDLFDPPQREEFRQRVVQLRVDGHKENEVAALLKITKTAAQRAASLQRMMDRLGIDSPWLPVTEPPEDYPKLRRHHHQRYRFEPLSCKAGE